MFHFLLARVRCERVPLTPATVIEATGDRTPPFNAEALDVSRRSTATSSRPGRLQWLRLLLRAALLDGLWAASQHRRGWRWGWGVPGG